MPKHIAQAAQQMGPAITQLTRPDAELMAGVNRSQRLATGHQLIAGKNFGELRTIEKAGWQAEHAGHFIAHRNKVRVTQWLRIQSSIKSVGQRSKAVVKHRQIIREGFRGVHCVGFLAKDWGHACLQQMTCRLAQDQNMKTADGSHRACSSKDKPNLLTAFASALKCALLGRSRPTFKVSQ